jgi:hypothetical protein
MAPWAAQPQRLVDSVRRHGGLSFLAHPVDPPAPLFHEPDLSWVDWDIRGFTGIEIWNFMSQYKGWLQSWPGALLASLFPDWFLQGPFAPILRLWDENLTAGRPLVAIGSADAHGLPIAWGPFRRVIFPYEYLFRASNSHVLCPDSWTGRSEDDAARLYSSLRTGSCFVANDRAASSRGFRFSATDDQGIVPMGGSARARFGVTFQIRTPRPAHLRMIRNGVLLKQWPQAESAVLTAHDPGAYRVEAHLTRTGRRRPWIYSNAIHVAP